MKNITIKKIRALKGEITVPGDKSISHRAIIFGAIAEGDTIVSGFLEGEDNLRTLNAFRLMGVEIDEPKNSRLVIHGKGLRGLGEPIDVIDAGNSGTTTRLLTGLLAGQNFFSVITGDEYLRKRPMKRVIEPLLKMGALIYGRGNNNLAPLSIIGRKLKAIDYISPIASAQAKSAILLAGLYADGITSVTEPIRSRDHTERLLKAFGADIRTDGLKVSIKGGNKLNAMALNIPGDISSAAFFIVAGLIIKGSEILIRNVGINPTRIGVIDLLQKMGGDVKLLNQRESSGEPVADVFVRGSELNDIEINKDDIPKTIDEIPILCIAAAFAEGKTKITGAEELRVKESDRIRTMAEGLTRLGVDVEEMPDGMVIKGSRGQGVKGSRRKIIVNSFGDHRIAMSMVIAGLARNGETVVEDIDCINTSFPNFLNLVKKLEAGGRR